MRTKFPWLKNRRKTEPELPYEPPFWFGNRSNGEYFRPASARDRKVREVILNKADESARKLGVDRREFLASALGMTTTLWAIANVPGCSSDDGPGSGPPVQPNRCMMPQTTLDESVACGMLRGNGEFIMDVQTHWFKREDLDRFQAYRNLFGFLFDRANEASYINEMFLNSDTTVAALTSWPGVTCLTDDDPNEVCGLPLNNDSMAESRNRINQLSANTRRVVQHVQLLPQGPGGIEPELAMMERICADWGAAAWKLYPGFGPGFKMDDERGRAIIEKGLQIGLKQFCIHKGLQIGGFFLPDFNYPDDIGVVAKDYPDANFVIYHSAICAGHMDCSGDDAAPPEGVYDPTNPRPSGTNSLIRSLADRGIGPDPGQTPNKNVYGEVGSAINEVMNDPVQSAHFFGKLMKYLGPDYVVWGTDCVIYGSPQRFIDWFRNLTIPPEMQEMYGYPPLDDTNKRKILGLNAARLYGLDPEETRCQVERTATYKLKQQLDEELGPRRWAFQTPGGPKTQSEAIEAYRESLARGRPG